MLHWPFSFFGLYTTESRLMLDAYAGFFDTLCGGESTKIPRRFTMYENYMGKV